MASTNCWRCLSRPTPAQLATSINRLCLAPSAAFSTTPSRLLPMPAKKKKGPALALKGVKTLRIKKKAPAKEKGKPPAPGERKAMRKRIVLSNTNALEVEGMQDLDGEMVDGMAGKLPPKEEGEEPTSAAEEGAGLQTLMDEVLPKDEDDTADQSTIRKKLVGRDLVGKVVGLKGETVDSLRAAEAFKITQGWGLFRRPGVLVREESVQLSEKMVKAQDSKTALKLVLDGKQGSGKSIMLLHAMATAFVKGWVVINIPEAQEVTNAVTEYSAIPGTYPALYTQNIFMASLLTQISKANNSVLQDIECKLDHSDLPVPLQSNISLARLCELGARDPEIAWSFFQAFWSEITADGRPPVLFCFDGLNFIMQDSLYRAKDYSPIHALDLAIVKHFTDLLSGVKPMPNGGAVLAATSKSHAPTSLSMDLALANALERQANASIEVENEAIRKHNSTVREEADRLEERHYKTITKRDPYEKKYDYRAEKVLESAEIMHLKGVTKLEARGLMEYWAQSGVLRARVDERTVAEKWSLAGSGIVGEMQRSALWMQI